MAHFQIGLVFWKLDLILLQLLQKWLLVYDFSPKIKEHLNFVLEDLKCLLQGQLPDAYGPAYNLRNLMLEHVKLHLLIVTHL